MAKKPDARHFLLGWNSRTSRPDTESTVIAVAGRYGWEADRVLPSTLLLWRIDKTDDASLDFNRALSELVVEALSHDGTGRDVNWFAVECAGGGLMGENLLTL